MLSDQEWMATRLSLIVATCATVLALGPAVLLGYGLSRPTFRGRWLVETLVNLPLVLPPVVTGYLLLMLFSPRGAVGSFLERALGLQIAFTWLGAVLAAAIMSLPLMVRAMRVAFAGVDPQLEAAARTMGAGRVDAFCSVSLPLAWHGVIGGLALGFARSLGEFGATILIAGNIIGETQTIPLAIYSQAQRPGGFERVWPLVAVSIVLAVITLAAAEWLERRGGRRELT